MTRLTRGTAGDKNNKSDLFFLNHPQRVARPGGNMAQKKKQAVCIYS